MFFIFDRHYYLKLRLINLRQELANIRASQILLNQNERDDDGFDREGFNRFGYNRRGNFRPPELNDIFDYASPYSDIIVV